MLGWCEAIARNPHRIPNTTRTPETSGDVADASQTSTLNEKSPGRSASRSSNISKASSPTTGTAPRSQSRLSVCPSTQDICRICHCEGDEESPLITPCRCTGTLRFVHQSCLHQWIKSSDTRCCELCKYDFIMETKLKPLRKWEKLQMTTSERRKIFCSVTFHVIAVTCVVWSLYVLIDRTAEEIKQGNDNGKDLSPFPLPSPYGKDRHNGAQGAKPFPKFRFPLGFQDQNLQGKLYNCLLDQRCQKSMGHLRFSN